jgi:hypothetical protein
MLMPTPAVVALAAVAAMPMPTLPSMPLPTHLVLRFKSQVSLKRRIAVMIVMSRLSGVCVCIGNMVLV